MRTRVKDAICDALRDAGRPKPLPPDGPADLPLFVSCFQVMYTMVGCATATLQHYRTLLHDHHPARHMTRPFLCSTPIQMLYCTALHCIHQHLCTPAG